MPSRAFCMTIIVWGVIGHTRSALTQVDQQRGVARVELHARERRRSARAAAGCGRSQSASQAAAGEKIDLEITAEDVRALLGRPRVDPERANGENEVGVTTGMHYTPVGGDIIGLLLGLSPSDPITLLVVPLLLALVGCGEWLPTRRAARLEQMSALRSD